MQFANPLLTPSEYQLSIRQASLPVGFNAKNNIFTGDGFLLEDCRYIPLLSVDCILMHHHILVSAKEVWLFVPSASALSPAYLPPPDISAKTLSKTMYCNAKNAHQSICFVCLFVPCANTLSPAYLQTFLQRRFPKPYLATQKICISQFASANASVNLLCLFASTFGQRAVFSCKSLTHLHMQRNKGCIRQFPSWK